MLPKWVFIMVKCDIIIFKQKEYKTDCEIVWVKIELVGTKYLFLQLITAPKRETPEFHKLLEMVRQHKGDIWVLSDFRLG